MPRWIWTIVAGTCAVMVGGLAIYFALQAHLDVGVPTAPPPGSGPRR